MAESTPSTSAPRRRGRPRTILDDHEVPERRRKQLRVAQQAYRRRKETTITNLQTRVQLLESGIEDLSQSFLSFSHLLLEADLLDRHPRIASALQEITQQCVFLSKQGCPDLDQDVSVGTKAARRKTTVTPEASHKTVTPEASRKTKTTPDSSRRAATTPESSCRTTTTPESDCRTATTPESDCRATTTPENHVEVYPDLAQSNSFVTPPESSSQSSATLTRWPSPPMPPTPPYQEQAGVPFPIAMKSPPMPFLDPFAMSPSPPATISPESLMKAGRWTVSHRLVRECFQNGYHLLLDPDNNMPRLEEIFGTLSVMDRNRIMSRFYMDMNDHVGDVIELRAQVLNPMRIKMSDYTPEMAAHASRAWQIVVESGGDELLDASGVQRLLLQRGIYHQDMDSAGSSPRVGGPCHFNATVFVKLLALCGVCVGPGPAFRRRDVENALYYACSNGSSGFGDTSGLLR